MELTVIFDTVDAIDVIMVVRTVVLGSVFKVMFSDTSKGLICCKNGLGPHWCSSIGFSVDSKRYAIRDPAVRPKLYSKVIMLPVKSCFIVAIVFFPLEIRLKFIFRSLTVTRVRLGCVYLQKLREKRLEFVKTTNLFLYVVKFTRNAIYTVQKLPENKRMQAVTDI